ncbi:MAG: G1 family endopeptidase [Candidatus Marsarchaeota archaeon]|nr:G1 family endopeptidase [Candidatus Marsarchaeota archaeon]
MQVFKNKQDVDESSRKFLRHKNGGAEQAWNIAGRLKNIAAASFIAVALAASPASISGKVSGNVSGRYNENNNAGAPVVASAQKNRNNAHAFSVSLSRNWSGYITESSFKHPLPVVSGIKGEWNVPEIKYVKPKKNLIIINLNGMPFFLVVRPPSDVSEWIGIGGSKSYDRTLIQTGVDSSYSKKEKKFVNQAWYELLPSHPVYIPRKELAAKPGDEIYAEINLLNKGKNQWEIIIDDLTRNQTFKKIVTYKSSMMSGEWIVEDSTVAPKIALENGASFRIPILCSLSYFETIKFESAVATVNSNTLPLGELKSKTDIMANLHWKDGRPNALQLRAVPSKIINHGLGFEVRRTNKILPVKTAPAANKTSANKQLKR